MFKKGAVIRFYVKNITDPHPKYLVILDHDVHKASYAVVLINSNANLNINCTPELLALQYNVTQAKNGFLHHDSVVDCAQVKLYLCDEVNAAVAANLKAKLGSLHPDDLKTVCEMVRKADTTPPHILKNYKI